ncbi:MAG: 1-carboxy-3-chloro-3,4-dihydroxycyclo hexa-1,5-diene dehydrogenase [Hyphococcus sp.]|nr:MAG: 1-carboxy-3-chloro-3,4-dihydroxycyclo hexa-1,5-diene dehydrogenase [Marinicaulis sp.]
MTKLKIGLVGTGYIGKIHALGFRNAQALFPDLPPIELTTICDAEADRAERMRKELGFLYATDRWRNVVEDPELNIIAIATPNFLHHEMATAALKSGKHVYCEKPMGVSLDEACDMADAAARANARTLLAYNYLRSPAFIHAQKLVRGGRIGRIFYFRGVYEEEYMADAEVPFSWRCEKVSAGAGALGDLGSHLLCAAVSLLGAPLEVSADINTVIPTRLLAGENAKQRTVENEDIAHALLRFPEGVTATFMTSRVSWGRKNHLSFEIYGENGSIRFDQERLNELQFFEKDVAESENGYRTILTGPSHPPYDHFIPSAGHQIGFNDLKTIEIAEFIKAISEKSPLFPSFHDGVTIEKTMDAILQSAASRKWVTVDAPIELN